MPRLIRTFFTIRLYTKILCQSRIRLIITDDVGKRASCQSKDQQTNAAALLSSLLFAQEWNKANRIA